MGPRFESIVAQDCGMHGAVVGSQAKPREKKVGEREQENGDNVQQAASIDPPAEPAAVASMSRLRAAAGIYEVVQAWRMGGPSAGKDAGGDLECARAIRSPGTPWRGIVSAIQ